MALEPLTFNASNIYPYVDLTVMHICTRNDTVRPVRHIRPCSNYALVGYISKKPLGCYYVVDLRNGRGLLTSDRWASQNRFFNPRRVAIIVQAVKVNGYDVNKLGFVRKNS